MAIPVINGKNVRAQGIRFLVTGAGAVVEKMQPAWHLFEQQGVDLHAADIFDDPPGKLALGDKAHFYNWQDRKQLDQLIRYAQSRPFDYVYLSTGPAVHIFTALRLDSIAKNFIFPKPVDSNFLAMKRSMQSTNIIGHSIW